MQTTLCAPQTSLEGERRSEKCQSSFEQIVGSSFNQGIASQLAEKLEFRCPAPKGASDFERAYGIAKAIP
jgi:hypothetical protein